MRKRIKTLIVACTFMVFGLFLGACGSTAYAEQSYPLKIWYQNQNGMCKTWNVVDEDTGVNYIVVTTSSRSTHASYSIAITPRLNADRTLYVTPVAKQGDL